MVETDKRDRRLSAKSFEANHRAQGSPVVVVDRDGSRVVPEFAGHERTRLVDRDARIQLAKHDLGDVRRSDRGAFDSDAALADRHGECAARGVGKSVQALELDTGLVVGRAEVRERDVGSRERDLRTELRFELAAAKRETHGTARDLHGGECPVQRRSAVKMHADRSFKRSAVRRQAQRLLCEWSRRKRCADCGQIGLQACGAQ